VPEGSAHAVEGSTGTQEQEEGAEEGAEVMCELKAGAAAEAEVKPRPEAETAAWTAPEEGVQEQGERGKLRREQGPGAECRSRRERGEQRGEKGLQRKG